MKRNLAPAAAFEPTQLLGGILFLVPFSSRARPKPDPVKFDGARAYELVLEQNQAGCAHPGSLAHAQTGVDWSELEAEAGKSTHRKFESPFRGNPWVYTTFIGLSTGRPGPNIILGRRHYGKSV